MDEAGSRVRMAVDSKPEELDEIDRRIVQLKIEREALSKETDAASKARLEKLEEELDELEGISTEMTARWKAEKEKVSSEAQSREALDRLRAELVSAQRRGDLQRASEIAYGEIPKPGEGPGRGRSRRGAAGQPHPRRRRRRADRRGVSRWTGVPVEKMLEGEREKLLAMEDGLRKRVVGQEEALAAVSDACAAPRRPEGPAAPDRLVPVPGPHRRRQDRAHQGAGRVHVRRRGRPSPAST
jgi:ATP-dependent Clp protease ATP-binding subunit ClpB